MELDRDRVFLRCAFEREKKFGAPKGAPTNATAETVGTKAGALKREETASARNLFVLSRYF